MTYRITQAELKALMSYSPETGVFVWLIPRKNNQVKVGDIVGHLNAKLGYLITNLSGRPAYLHRLAWMYTYGRWPYGVIDHINGDKSDNRLSNIREVTRAINAQNKDAPGKSNTSGFAGVSRAKGRTKWTAKIGIAGKYIHLGQFDTATEASVSYMAAKYKLHPGYAR